MPATPHPTPVRALTQGKPHFFGYYDKCPWSPDGSRLLVTRAEFQDRPPVPGDVLTLGTVPAAGGEFTPFAETAAWCWQQGTMLQWLDDSRVIYNSWRDGALVGVVHDIDTGQQRTVDRPVYAVHPGGHEAISLDFHRLQTLRPGYGYPPAVEITEGNLAPADIGLWRVDLVEGSSRLIMSIAEGQALQHDPRSAGVANWFNHATYNTDGSRFCFLHRFRNGPWGWHTRLLTMDSAGKTPFVLNDHDVTSHFAWGNPQELLAWAARRGPTGEPKLGYYVFTDQTHQVRQIGEGVLLADGHMTYSPNGRWLLTDEYPNPSDSCQPLLLFELATGRFLELGRFHTVLDGELRCDLHPRWNRDGTQICFDSSHSGTRQLYVADVPRDLLSAQ